MERSLTDGWRKDWREYFLQQKFFDITDENELVKRSAVKFYKNIKNIPILIVHGTADESVNFQDALDIHRLLPQSELLVYEGDDHQITANKNILKEEIIKFLQN
jgi:dipeptidyl aminopeptidase/acylaminoacyl peptidase